MSINLEIYLHNTVRSFTSRHFAKA